MNIIITILIAIITYMLVAIFAILLEQYSINHANNRKLWRVSDKLIHIVFFDFH